MFPPHAPRDEQLLCHRVWRHCETALLSQERSPGIVVEPADPVSRDTAKTRNQNGAHGRGRVPACVCPQVWGGGGGGGVTGGEREDRSAGQGLRSSDGITIHHGRALEAHASAQPRRLTGITIARVRAFRTDAGRDAAAGGEGAAEVPGRIDENRGRERKTGGIGRYAAATAGG